MKSQVGPTSVYLFTSVTVFLTQLAIFNPEARKKIVHKTSRCKLKNGNVPKLLNLALRFFKMIAVALVVLRSQGYVFFTYGNDLISAKHPIPHSPKLLKKGFLRYIPSAIVSSSLKIPFLLSLLVWMYFF